MEESLMRLAADFGVWGDEEDFVNLLEDEAEGMTPAQKFMFFTMGFATGGTLVCIGLAGAC